MQNKANFKKLPMSANPFTQTTYENFYLFGHPKNKANSKPNKANFKKRKNERKLFTAKGLRAKTGLFPPKKQSQFKANPEQSRGMNISYVYTKVYENKCCPGPKKTNPIQTQFQGPSHTQRRPVSDYITRHGLDLRGYDVPCYP